MLKNWRVILVTLLAANLVFVALFSMQTSLLAKKMLRPSEERLIIFTKELADAKATELSHVEFLKQGLAEMNVRIKNIEKAVEESSANSRETRAIRAEMDLLKASIAAKP